MQGKHTPSPSLYHYEAQNNCLDRNIFMTAQVPLSRQEPPLLESSITWSPVRQQRWKQKQVINYEQRLETPRHHMAPADVKNAAAGRCQAHPVHFWAPGGTDSLTQDMLLVPEHVSEE